MAQKRLMEDQCFILIKALPHRSSKYYETVCCAGVGRDGKWRRQYPVPFRILDQSQKFGRWDWIKYEYTTSEGDRRIESQKVVPESLVVSGRLKESERARFLNPLVRDSFEDANSRSESLTILRPKSIELLYWEKTESEITKERRKHAELAKQTSLFDKTAKALEPCPIQFSVRWRDSNGKARKHVCDDWETSTAFNRFERKHGRQKALGILKKKYSQYMNAGLVLAFSTHSRRNVTFGTENQWLLVGLIRLDPSPQGDMFLS